MPAPRVIDSAGAGDMVTSGLIHVLLQHGMPVLDVPTLETGLRFGQTLAALNCGFVGARGLFAALRQHNPDLMEKVGRSDTLDSDLVALLSPQAGPLLREVDLRSLVS
jgi:fructokinase